MKEPPAKSHQPRAQSVFLAGKNGGNEADPSKTCPVLEDITCRQVPQTLLNTDPGGGQEASIRLGSTERF